MSLQSGLDAFKQGRYQEAIQLLEQFSRNCVDEISPGYLNAQMWLLKAYQATGELASGVTLTLRDLNKNYFIYLKIDFLYQYSHRFLITNYGTMILYVHGTYVSHS